MIDFHLVTEGDTLYSLAKQYNMPLERLMLENDYDYYRELNIGQIINISEAERSYVVKPGDTILKILEENNISLLELIKNNPQLSERGLRVGDYLILDYGVKETDIELNGMCFSFIAPKLLMKTLPYLTYITVMGYRIDQIGNISYIDDDFIVSTAKEYGVTPLMLISSQNDTGVGSYDITNNLLSKPILQVQVIDNAIEIAKQKGYLGVVFGFQFILDIDIANYKRFIDYGTNRLHEEGLLSWEVVIPKLLYGDNNQSRLEVSSNIDGAILLSYQWANNFAPNAMQTSYNYNRATLEILLGNIDPKKVSLGISRIAYDWELPYVEGESFVSSLTDPGALALANQYNAIIQYDTDARHPYFTYMTNNIEHEVWFKDARYTVAILDLVIEYGLGGISVWNIMYFSRIWFTLNIMANIRKYLPVQEERILELIEKEPKNTDFILKDI